MRASLLRVCLFKSGSDLGLTAEFFCENPTSRSMKTTKRIFHLRAAGSKSKFCGP